METLIGCLSLSSNQVTAVALWKEIQQLFTETLFSTNLMMKFTRRPCLPHPTILKKSKLGREKNYPNQILAALFYMNIFKPCGAKKNQCRR